MPAKTVFVLEHTLPGHFDVVYASLLDLKKFGEIHPFMIDVKLLDDKNPAYKEYSIVEEIYFLGFIKNNPKYNAKVMEIEKDKHIRYTSLVKKFIFLTVDIRFSKDKNKNLLVTETFEISANRLIGMVFASILKKAHSQFVKNLKSFLQTSVEDLKLT